MTIDGFTLPTPMQLQQFPVYTTLRSICCAPSAEAVHSELLRSEARAPEHQTYKIAEYLEPRFDCTVVVIPSLLVCSK